MSTKQQVNWTKTKEAFLKTIHEKMESNAYEEALHMCFLFEEKVYPHSPNQHEDLVMVYGLKNTLHRNLYTQDITVFHVYDLKHRLEQLKTKDLSFHIKAYEGLLDISSFFNDFQLTYDLLWALIPLYRANGEHNQVKRCYQDVLNKLETMRENVIAFGMRVFDIDSSDIPKNKPIHAITYDPIENTSTYKTIHLELEKTLHQLIGLPGNMGYCYPYWSLKKTLLKEHYQLDWIHPGLLNDAKFD